MESRGLGAAVDATSERGSEKPRALADGMCAEEAQRGPPVGRGTACEGAGAGVELEIMAGVD